MDTESSLVRVLSGAGVVLEDVLRRSNDEIGILVQLPASGEADRDVVPGRYRGRRIQHFAL